MKRIMLWGSPALALLLLGASCAPTKNPNTNTAVNTNTTAAVKTFDVTYSGQDGKTALELLTQTHVVDVTQEGYVNAIDGRHPAGRQFWAFYVNGQEAATGAKVTATKNSDTIGWRLESY